MLPGVFGLAIRPCLDAIEPVEENTASSLQWSKTALRSRSSLIADLMAQALARPHLLSLAAGFTDNAVVPADIVRDAVAAMPASGEALQYSSNQGRPKLREALAARLNSLPGETGFGPGAAGVIMTNGSQQSLYMLAQVLCNPGDIALVESPTYFVVFDVLAGLGIEAIPLPARADGQTDAAGAAELLERLRREGRLDRVKLAYFISYYSNPGAHCMDLDVKRTLGSVFAVHAPRVLTVEDTAYRDLWFDAPHPAPSMFSLPEWEGLPLVQTGSFSKCFSPGLRLGYLCTKDAALVEHVLRVKAQQDFGSGNLSQYIAEYALESGGFEPFLRRIRPHYKAKAVAMHEALLQGGLREAGWRWEQPAGGLLFWLRGPEGMDASMDSAFCRACLEENVLYVPGDICYAGTGAPRNGVRLAIGVPAMADLKEAARRFAVAAHRAAS